MKRTKKTRKPLRARPEESNALKIPDAINCTARENYTRVDNNMLRDPNLSAKAKGILALLLSNRDGWHSYLSSIIGMMSDGKAAMRSGLTELEQGGYLVRIKYREKDTKKIRGSFWAYTDVPGNFKMEGSLALLEENGFEPIGELSRSGKPTSGEAYRGEPDANNTKEKKTKEKKKIITDPTTTNNVPNNHITPSMFERFYKMYPRKVAKGQAKNAWEKICRQSPNERPTWAEVKAALRQHKESSRWQDPGPKSKSIPYPSTWLNQERWYDDPGDMPERYGDPFWEDDSPSSSHSTVRVRPHTDPHELIEEELGRDLGRSFITGCYEPAEDLIPNPQGLAEALLNLHIQIENAQDHFTAEMYRIMPEYGPVTLLEAYVNWLHEQNRTWLKDPKMNLFDITHSLFQRFCREYSDTDAKGRHPLTGEPPRDR